MQTDRKTDIVTTHIDKQRDKQKDIKEGRAKIYTFPTEGKSTWGEGRGDYMNLTCIANSENNFLL